MRRTIPFLFTALLALPACAQIRVLAAADSASYQEVIHSGGDLYYPFSAPVSNRKKTGKPPPSLSPPPSAESRSPWAVSLPLCSLSPASPATSRSISRYPSKSTLAPDISTSGSYVVVSLRNPGV